jgi:hypothetical protein
MGYPRLIWFTLGGIVAGYLLMHPFAMLAYVLGPQHPAASLGFKIWEHQMHQAFSPDMLVMGGPFAFMGGITGFCLGAWSLQKEWWLAEKLESQQRLVALETLRKLMVTLAHYIRNSNIVIGGFSAHLLKDISEVDSTHKLQMGEAGFSENRGGDQCSAKSNGNQHRRIYHQRPGSDDRPGKGTGGSFIQKGDCRAA